MLRSHDGSKKEQGTITAIEDCGCERRQLGGGDQEMGQEEDQEGGNARIKKPINVFQVGPKAGVIFRVGSIR